MRLPLLAPTTRAIDRVIIYSCYLSHVCFQPPCQCQCEGSTTHAGSDSIEQRARYGPFIGGKAIATAADVESIAIRSPATNELLSDVASATPEQVDDAIARAHAAFRSGVWARASPQHRSLVLARLAAKLQERVPHLATIESMQTGRAIREMKTQLGRLPEWLTYFAALLRTYQGFLPPTQGQVLSYVTREPLGVVAQITPFNHPLLIAIKKIAPALAAGNSVIVKPSELAPASVLEFAEMASEAGLPDDVLQVLPGDGRTVASEIVKNSLIKKVDVTAGTSTGRAIGALVGANLSSYTAELGGKAPVLVFEDADLPSAVNGVAFAAFVASGQTCVSGARIIVQESIYDQFLPALVAKVENITRRMGNPLNPVSTMGPVISERQLRRIEAMVSRTTGNIAIGGKRMTTASSLDGHDLSKGWFFPPTVITDVTTDDELWNEEIFGPVIVLHRFKDEADAVRLANASKYGLGSGIWTSQLGTAHRVAAQLEHGLVWVNTAHRNDPSSPWGGMKESGIGRENGIEGLESYSQSKTVLVNIATPEYMRENEDWFTDESKSVRYG